LRDHLKSVRTKIQKSKVSKPQEPWKLVAGAAIGGLRSVGFDRNSDQLLVVSSQGRGVFDCISGERLARNPDEYFGKEVHLEAEGIGPLEGKTITVAGLLGGGLPRVTEDGWCIELVTIDWPDVDILLVEPGSSLYGSLYGKPDAFQKIGSDSELRACGFSHTGKSFVIATSSDLIIYAR
jgi:hypothetical protein